MTEIRFAADQFDLLKIRDLGKEMMEESHFNFMSVDYEKTESFFRNCLENKQYCLLLAEQGHDPRGMIVAHASEYFFNKDIIATILMYFVREQHRRSSAAIKLIHGFRQWAINRNAREILVPVTSGVRIDETDRFLRRAGFDHLGGNYALRL